MVIHKTSKNSDVLSQVRIQKADKDKMDDKRILFINAVVEKSSIDLNLEKKNIQKN